MQNSFTISPMVQKIVLKPGDTYHGSILVANPISSTEIFNFQVSLSPYSVSKDGTKVDFENMSDWSRIVSWTELGLTKGTLKPNDTVRIPFAIKVPEDAPAGGQYLMIGVSYDAPVADSNSSTIQDVYEMGSLIFAEIEGKTIHEGRILENSIPGFVALGSPAVTVNLSNDGNVHETATVKIQVKNTITGETYKFSDDGENTYQTTVMPDTTKAVTRNLDGLPQLGIFEVNQSVLYLDTESNITTMMVVCPIWFMALVAGVIISIAGMIAYTIHLRRKKAKKLATSKSEDETKN